MSTNGTATIGGVGSILTTIGGSIGVGDGGTGTLIVNNGASVVNTIQNFGEAFFAGFGPGGNGTIIVNAGGLITSARSSIAGGDGTGTAGISGTWTNSTTFEVGGLFGSSTDGSGTVNVNSGGLLNVGTVLTVYGPGRVNVNAGGQVTVNTLAVSGGAFNLHGGTLNLPAFTAPTSGSFNFSSGAVAFTGDWSGTAAQISGLLGSGASLTSGKTIQVAGATTLQSGLTLSGGTLRTGSITGLGSLVLNSGTLELTNSSLTIGAAGPLGALVTAGPGLNLRVSGPGRLLTIGSDGVLNLAGGTAAGTSIANAGEIAFGGPVAALGLPGQALTNTGRLSGTGRVNASLANNANGRIISDAGGRLVFTGATNNNNANGTIEMTGGTIEFTGTLNNNAGGQISGRGVFRGSSANTSGIGLVNAGAVAFSGGFSDIYGKVTNTTGGRLLTVGGGTMTYHDNVVHNGAEIRTSAGARSVFLGAVSGAGSYTGTGTNEFQGDIRPGNSAAIISFGGDVILASSAKLHIELGGTSPGTEYDRVHVTGSLSLDGALAVSVIDLGAGLFEPEEGDFFDILNWTSLTGTFSAFQFPILDNGLAWDTSELYTNGVLSVGLAGDYNSDNGVDAADFVMWRKLNGTSTAMANDPNPLPIDGDQYNTWRSYFGEVGIGSGGSATHDNLTAPEPIALLLTLQAVVAMFALCGRRIGEGLGQAMPDESRSPT
jgi:T5SS/PEP-CTERM-associated repeat protein